MELVRNTVSIFENPKNIYTVKYSQIPRDQATITLLPGKWYLTALPFIDKDLGTYLPTIGLNKATIWEASPTDISVRNYNLPVSTEEDNSTWAAVGYDLWTGKELTAKDGVRLLTKISKFNGYWIKNHGTEEVTLEFDTSLYKDYKYSIIPPEDGFAVICPIYTYVPDIAVLFDVIDADVDIWQWDTTLGSGAFRFYSPVDGRNALAISKGYQLITSLPAFSAVWSATVNPMWS